MYTLRRTPKFEENAARLTGDVLVKLEKTLRFLSSNPRHKGLKTHKVQKATGFHGGDIFEAYVDMKHRLTFEYGRHVAEKVIVLRDIGKHDEALKDP